jgi:hypothetical protein
MPRLQSLQRKTVQYLNKVEILLRRVALVRKEPFDNLVFSYSANGRYCFTKQCLTELLVYFSLSIKSHWFDRYLRNFFCLDGTGVTATLQNGFYIGSMAITRTLVRARTDVFL